MTREDVATFAAAILSAEGYDPRRAAISLVVCAQALVADNPLNRQVLADTLRTTAAELDGDQQRMN